MEYGSVFSPPLLLLLEITCCCAFITRLPPSRWMVGRAGCGHRLMEAAVVWDTPVWSVVCCCCCCCLITSVRSLWPNGLQPTSSSVLGSSLRRSTGVSVQLYMGHLLTHLLLNFLHSFTYLSQCFYVLFIFIFCILLLKM